MNQRHPEFEEYPASSDDLKANFLFPGSFGGVPMRSLVLTTLVLMPSPAGAKLLTPQSRRGA